VKPLRNILDRAKPHFEDGGKLHAFRSVFEGMETFLYTPRTTSQPGDVHIHDSIDSKRVMIIVVLALMPCLFFGMYNTGYQNALASGAVNFKFWELFGYGFLAILPRIAVTYIVGLGIEFIVAQWRHEEIQEGFLVTGILIPMICPVETPLWMIAVATAFSVIFVKEVFGGTGYNIFNVALVARAFLFFAYPSQMSGDSVFIASEPILGLGGTARFVDGVSGATPLAQIATSTGGTPVLHNVTGEPLSLWDTFVGLIPGSFGETSTLCVCIGALILLATGIASWRIIVSAIGGCRSHESYRQCFRLTALSGFDVDSRPATLSGRIRVCSCIHGHRSRHSLPHQCREMGLRCSHRLHGRYNTNLQQRLPRRSYAGSSAC
jgi:Na+-transporting NADH:ubiquinone oxidoreductase subunit B